MLPDKQTVLIVDDDGRILNSLRRLLELNGYCVQVFASSNAVLNHPLPSEPCCAILDMQMPGLTGLELLSFLVKKRPGMPIILITGYGDIPQAVKAMKAGALDFLTKPVEEETLLGVIKRALIQEQTFRRDRGETAGCRDRFNTLSPREKEVCTLVFEGRLNKQIAAALGISEKTVKVHRGRVMKKLEVISVADLVRVVVKNGDGIGEESSAIPATEPHFKSGNGLMSDQPAYASAIHRASQVKPSFTTNAATDARQCP